MTSPPILFTLFQWDETYATDAHGNPLAPRRCEVWQVCADGSGLRKVVALPSVSAGGQWSGDGKHIYFQSNFTGECAIYRCLADGTGIENLTRSPSSEDYGFRLSPDGRRITYCGMPKGQHARVMLMDSDGRDHRVIVGDPYSYMPRFTPDGRSLVYVSLRPNYGVYRCNLDGSGERCYASQNGVDFHNPLPSPCGRYILCYRRERLEHDSTVEILRIDMDTGEARLLTQGQRHESVKLSVKDQHGSSDPPCWSPDGRRLAFVTGEREQLWTMNADGSDARQLTSLSGACGWPRFSPDGRFIAFSSHVGEFMQLFTVPAEGGLVTQLTALPGACAWAEWKPGN